ncbi:hypothetical protein Prum_032720 [Phytohabitans rumicis]|uniref:Ppx/GppA phosphatase N-terminal domain-containing protein n=1 Tax=Phytohabitans rumicis TaxID=1076125 RepID=A0A6V8L245_9ACTN|nr:hypothetical protein Prum_032720 [Phytohabitans rumicis]
MTTRVAAIDCGTNSIRLLIADIVGDRLVDVVRRMEIVRLGQGVDRTGRLAPEAIERTRVALADYAAVVRDLGPAGCGCAPPRPPGTRRTPTSSGPWCWTRSAYCRRW